MQDFSPRSVFVNGGKCAIGFVPNITAPVPPLSAASPAANLSSFVATGYVTTSGNRIIDVDGNPITLRGANWFGFETQVRSHIQWVSPFITLVFAFGRRCWSCWGSVKCNALYRGLALHQFEPCLLQANMVDGLYAGDSSLTLDFATVAHRIQLLGFNAIRIPFSFLVRSLAKTRGARSLFL